MAHLLGWSFDVEGAPTALGTSSIPPATTMFFELHYHSEEVSERRTSNRKVLLIAVKSGSCRESRRRSPGVVGSRWVEGVVDPKREAHRSVHGSYARRTHQTAQQQPKMAKVERCQ